MKPRQLSSARKVQSALEKRGDAKRAALAHLIREHRGLEARRDELSANRLAMMNGVRNPVEAAQAIQAAKAMNQQERALNKQLAALSERINDLRIDLKASLRQESSLRALMRET